MFLECTVGRDHNHMAHEYLALQIMPVGSMVMEVIISLKTEKNTMLWYMVNRKQVSNHMTGGNRQAQSYQELG